MAQQPVIEGAPSDQDLDELFQPSPDEGEGQEQETQKQPPEVKKEEAKPAPQPVTPPLTKEDFLAGIKTLVPSQQRQLSPQEVDKMLNVWNPNEEFINKFFNVEATPQERMAAFLQFVMELSRRR